MTVAVDLRRRAWNKWRRYQIARHGRRDFRLQPPVPYISFTFDDFPRSALVEGGSILESRGTRGTFFVSLGLLGADSPSGPIASRDDLGELLRRGHELGCHTFDHLDACVSTVGAFESSIIENGHALEAIVPEADFSVFAYPLDGPVLKIKRSVGQRFLACRGGGQTFNSGTIDLNLLKACFLDVRYRGRLDDVRAMIQRNVEARGWLIFATHDVASEPSGYGCEPEFFDEVVRLAVESGSRVVPVKRACEELRIAG